MAGHWKKVTPALVERFDACLPRANGVQRRQMFGCPCAFVNGNMFAGLHETRLIVRLPEADRARLIAKARAVPFTVLGRTMREYVAIEDALARSAAEIADAMNRALGYARTLAPKGRAAALSGSRGAAPAPRARRPASRRARRPAR